MILIADAGGTKTDWRLLDGDNIEQYATEGFNPNTHDITHYIGLLRSAFESILSQVKAIHFYGASIYAHNEEFKQALEGLFPGASVTLNNDLVGSCRALSPKKAGFIGIIGTGSAGCFFDGDEIFIHTPSLGYALGDEGSGASLGKKLLRLALRKRLDQSLQNEFDKTFDLTKEQAYVHIYRGDHPNAYMASFTKFLFEHRNHPQMNQLIMDEFKGYFESFFGYMPDLDRYQFHFSGSVAYYFGDYLRAIGVELGYSVGMIVQSPIAGLALYHQNHD